MDLQDAQILTELHMEAHGLIEKGWRFKFDRAARRFGQCSSSKKLISLSALLVELNVEAVVEQTILHEVAHAVVGTMHRHDNVWRRKAIELGHTGRRCYGEDVVTPRGAGLAPWTLVCDYCGQRAARFKRTRNPISCGRCSKTYNPKFAMRWERNIV